MWFRSSRKDKDKGKAKRAKPVPPSFIGAGLKIDGDVTSEGEVDIAGAVSGNIAVQKLTLFEGGTLEGTARAETATINGALSGRLAAGEVTLGTAARVTADITYVSLKIDAGAVFVGQSRRVESLDAIPPERTRLPAPVTAEPRIFEHARGAKLA